MAVKGVMHKKPEESKRIPRAALPSPPVPTHCNAVRTGPLSQEQERGEAVGQSTSSHRQAAGRPLPRTGEGEGVSLRYERLAMAATFSPTMSGLSGGNMPMSTPSLGFSAGAT